MTESEIHYITLLEKLALEVHPPLESCELDGWLLSFSRGYTRRVNSVLPFCGLEGSGTGGSMSLGEKVDHCHLLYKEHGLPCIFKMSDVSPAGLNELLERRGYSRQADSIIMVVDAESPLLQERLESIVEPEETGVIITSFPDEAWLNAFFVFEGRTASETKETATRQFELVDGNEDLTALYCRLQMWGRDVAVASAVMKDGIMYLLNVVVEESCRGKGYGSILVKEVLEAMCGMGAEKLCLQVLAENQVAQKLYSSFGFEPLYGYWYMVEPDASAITC